MAWNHETEPIRAIRARRGRTRLIGVDVSGSDGGVRDYSARSISNRSGERAGSRSLRKGSRQENHGETNQSKTNRGNCTRAGGPKSCPDHFCFPLKVDFIGAKSPCVAGPISPAILDVG